jgi:hypothetical protein
VLSEDDVFKSYSWAYLMRGQEHRPEAIEGGGEQLSEKCFLALSTTYFGAEHSEPSLIQRGLSQYGVALNELNTALASSSQSCSYGVLKSVVFMIVFEVSVSLPMGDLR